MSKRIESIGNAHQTEVGDAKTVETIPVFTLEIENKLRKVSPQKDIDLQFELSPANYQGLFKKDLTFPTMDEMNNARDLLAYLASLETEGEEYSVLNSPFTNSILVSTSETMTLKGSPTTKGEMSEDEEIEYTKSETFRFPNLKSYTYMVDVLKWMTDQEKHFT